MKIQKGTYPVRSLSKLGAAVHSWTKTSDFYERKFRSIHSTTKKSQRIAVRQ